MVALVCMSAPASADEVGEITSQVSHHEIHPDGSMTMTQTSTWRFSGNLESMFFTVPLGEKGVNELSNVSIVAPDGRQPKANFEEETDPNGRGVRRYTIHAKDFPLKSGPWKLQYTLSNTLVEDGDFSVLAFNIISPVNPTVGRWEATINSPWTISGVQCTIDQQEKCQVKRSEKSVTFSGGEAKPGTDVFLIVGYPISETGHVGRPQQPGGSTPETPSAPATPRIPLRRPERRSRRGLRPPKPQTVAASQALKSPPPRPATTRPRRTQTTTPKRGPLRAQGGSLPSRWQDCSSSR